MERMVEGYTEEQEARVTRAITESSEMTWTLGPLGWTVTTPGGCYQVGDGFCSCPDWKHRGSRTGTICKHQTALALKMLTEAPPPAAKPKGSGLPLMTDAECAKWDLLYN
jgi:hypothetical protein